MWRRGNQRPGLARSGLEEPPDYRVAVQRLQGCLSQCLCAAFTVHLDRKIPVDSEFRDHVGDKAGADKPKARGAWSQDDSDALLHPNQRIVAPCALRELSFGKIFTGDVPTEGGLGRAEIGQSPDVGAFEIAESKRGQGLAAENQVCTDEVDREQPLLLNASDRTLLGRDGRSRGGSLLDGRRLDR
jgi:hypothetical protein